MRPLPLSSAPLTEEQMELCLSRIADGELPYLDTLYRGTAASVYALAFSILKNSHDAEDVLHDCFLHVRTSAASYERRGTPLAWILTIARNLCLMRLRQQKKTADLEEWDAASLAAPSVSVEDRMVMQSLLTQLADDERQIVVLHAVSGFKHREIARLLGLPLSTVLSKYHRALKKLRAFFGKELSS